MYRPVRDHDFEDFGVLSNIVDLCFDNLYIMWFLGNVILILCDFKNKITSGFLQLPPLCKCGNILRPDVVWFGEALPQDVWKSAMIQASACDIMIVVGTSLEVSPANLLPVYAKQNGAMIIEVNVEKTHMSSSMDLSLRTSAAKALPGLVDIISQVK